MTQVGAPGQRGQRRIAGYVRVSTIKQQREGYSLPEQERHIRAYAVAMGWPDVDAIYVDVESGKSDERPQFQRLLAEADSIAHLIVTNIDRVGRNTLEFLLNDRLLSLAGVERVYIKQNVDTSTPFGRFAVTLFAAVAQLEGEQIVERTSQGQRSKVAAGQVWIVPYGYRYIPQDKGRGRPGQVVVDEEQAAIVRWIFEQVAGGMSASAVAILLSERGVPSPRRAGMWRHGRIARMIRHTAYEGLARYGVHRNVRVGPRTHLERADPASIITCPIPAIVSSSLAAQARAQLDRNRPLARRNSRRFSLLRGLVRCGRCHDEGVDHAMSGMPQTYACSRRDEATGRKREHRVGRLRLDRAVWASLCATILDPTDVLRSAAAVAQEGTTEAATIETEMAAIERGLEDLAAQQARLLDLYVGGTLTHARYAAKEVELLARRGSLLEQQATRAAQVARARSNALPLDDVRALCQRWAPRLTTMTDLERQSVVRALIREVRVYADHAEMIGYLPAWSSVVTLPPAQARGENGANKGAGGRFCRSDTEVCERQYSAPIPWRACIPLT